MKSNFILLFIISILFSISPSFSIAQDTSALNLKVEPYIFENSKKEKIQAEFGRFKVPENRSKKNGKKIELVFVRFKSTSKNPGSPIIYLAGGPGGSGISSAKGGRFELFMAMRQFGDVIAFDQRGAGRSKPNLRCTESFDLPLDQPMTHESLINQEIKNIKSCAKTWEAKGIDVSAYNTVENANDLNDLRKALGAKKVSLWGISYGTHLALATIRQHGKYIDRSILAGVEAMDDTYKLPSNTDKLIEELSQRLKANPKLSKKIPNLIGLINKVHERLAANPATVEVTDPRTKKNFKVTVGLFDLQFLLANFSGSNRAQSMILSLYYSMSNGNFSFLAQQVARYRKGRNSNLMSIAMDCASGISKRRFAQIEKEKQTAIYANAINMPFPGICSAINYKNLGKKFRKPVKSKVPVLFISGTLDGRTPVSNAEAAIKGFKNSSHLIIDGAGHSDPLFLSTPKIKETMLKFMSRKKLASTIYTRMAKPFSFMPIAIRSKTSSRNSTNADKTKMNAAINGLLKPDGSKGSVEEAIAYFKLKGLSVAVFENYKIKWTKSWGIKAAGNPEKIDENTAFSTASISKPMTATLFAMLEEKGLINFDTPINQYLKRWKLPENALTKATPVTLKHLLSHTAGTTQSGFADFYLGDKIPTLVESLQGKLPRYNREIEVDFKPGTEWRYSGGGYVIAQMAVEDHLGISLADLADKYLFKPLGLKNTTMKQHGERGFLTNIAKVHDRNGKIIGTGIPICPQIAPSGMWSTPTDLAKFVIETQRALRGDKTKVISQRVAKRVTSIVTTKLVGGHSYGWNRSDSYGNREWFSHGGSNTGTGGYLLGTMKDGNGIAILGNSDSSLLFRTILPFQASIIKAHKWNRPHTDKKIQISNEFAKKITGPYLAGSSMATLPFVNSKSSQITFKNNKLLATNLLPFGAIAELIQINENTFAVENFNGTLSFLKNPRDGKLYLTVSRRGLKNSLEYVYEKYTDGKKLPSAYLSEGDFQNALKGYKGLKKAHYKNLESDINDLGYQHLGQKSFKIAIQAFRINVSLFPDSANAYDSLGESYMKNGEKEKAIVNYKRALELNPQNKSARQILKKLQMQ